MADMRPGVGPTTASRAATLGSATQVDIFRARILDARTAMNRFAVEIQKKFALAAACVVFVLLGAPIALRFPRGGVGLVLGVSLVVFALYYVGLIAGETLADKLILNPFWAMWMANILFTVIGVSLLLRVQRTAATARAGGLGETWESIRASIARRLPRLGLIRSRRRRPA
jgi:lipopolysaccharide export system permease protein